MNRRFFERKFAEERKKRAWLQVWPVGNVSAQHPYYGVSVASFDHKWSWICALKRSYWLELGQRLLWLWSPIRERQSLPQWLHWKGVATGWTCWLFLGLVFCSSEASCSFFSLLLRIRLWCIGREISPRIFLVYNGAQALTLFKTEIFDFPIYCLRQASVLNST